jgi:hypothetical protein
MLKQVSKLLDVYEAEYANTTLRLREKGSKNKFFHKKNKLTAHSRAYPCMIRMLEHLFTAKLAQLDDPSPKKYIQAINALVEGTKGTVITIGINYIVIL